MRALKPLAATLAMLVPVMAYATSHVIDGRWGGDGRFARSAIVEP